MPGHMNARHSKSSFVFLTYESPKFVRFRAFKPRTFKGVSEDHIYCQLTIAIAAVCHVDGADEGAVAGIREETEDKDKEA